MALKIKKLIPVSTVVNKIELASTICEPSVCYFGHTIFYTGNWFAFKSTDNGKSFQYLNPDKVLEPPGVKFDCDQTVIHDPSRKLTFWILQYKNRKSKYGENVLRIAVNRDPDLADDAWYWWDIKPEDNRAWRHQWFDFNHVALSDNFLYVGSNMYKRKVWTRCLIFKLPLDKLADPKNKSSYTFFSSTKYSCLRCTLGAKQTMYFASNDIEEKIKIFEWPEKGKKVREHTAAISPYMDTEMYKAICPDRKNWLGRCDARITAAWVSQDTLGFMWTAGKEKGKPYPYVRCVRLDTKNYKVIDEPDIWSKEFAYAWPDVCPNEKGQLGITLFRGGGAAFPDHLIGVFNETQKNWEIGLAKNGTNSPNDRTWGDYLTCRTYSPGEKTWVATGFVLSGEGARENIRAFLVHFSA